MEDIKIQFEGFSPPSFVQAHFKDLMEQIREEAPTWANVRATVHRVGREFRGVVKITSHAGAFFATATSGQLNELGHQLIQRMRRRLGRWKAKRFDHESIRR